MKMAGDFFCSTPGKKETAMNDRMNGYLWSGAVHAACLSLLLMLPAANSVPLKTFHIRFVQSASRQAEAPEAKPPAAPRVAEKKAALPPVQQKRPVEAARPLPQPIPEPVAAVPPAPASLPQTPAVAATAAAPRAPNTGAASVASALSGEKPSASAAAPAGGPSIGTGASPIVETRFGDLDAPTFIHRELPVYPRVARRMEKEGRVVLKLLIDPTGKLREVEVLEGAAFGFTESAIEAVRKSVFAPARRKGEAISAWAVLPVRFNLE
jgi:periplasmic protein TonB